MHPICGGFTPGISFPGLRQLRCLAPGYVVPAFQAENQDTDHNLKDFDNAPQGNLYLLHFTASSATI